MVIKLIRCINKQINNVRIEKVLNLHIEIIRRVFSIVICKTRSLVYKVNQENQLILYYQLASNGARYGGVDYTDSTTKTNVMSRVEEALKMKLSIVSKVLKREALSEHY